MDNISIFLNSDYMFVEYMDIIKCPALLLVGLCRGNEKLNTMLDLDHIKYLQPSGLYEWYLNREYRNVFYNLRRKNVSIPDKVLDELLESQLAISNVFYEYSVELKMATTIKHVLRDKLVNKVYIYNEFYNEHIADDIQKMFGEYGVVEFVYGDLKDALSNVSFNSTFVFSDVEKIYALIDAEKINMSSVIFPYEYRYNKKNYSDVKIDLPELHKKYIFKDAFYAACTNIDESGISHN